MHPLGPASLRCLTPGQGEHLGPQDRWCLGSNLSYLQVLGEPKQNRKLVAEISLVNPLAVPLNGCVFVVEGTGLTEGQLVKEL